MRRVDYRRVFRGGEVYRVEGIKVVCLKGVEKRLFGLSISGHIKSAVVRNRLRRKLKEIYRRHRQSIQSDVQMVVIVRPEMARARFAELEEGVLRGFRKAQVFVAQ